MCVGGGGSGGGLEEFWGRRRGEGCGSVPCEGCASSLWLIPGIFNFYFVCFPLFILHVVLFPCLGSVYFVIPSFPGYVHL